MERQDINSIVENSFSTIDCYVNNFERITHCTSNLMYKGKSCPSNPLLSVIIPTYNREQFFSEALESVYNQIPTNFEWEIIVVDNTPLNENGSTPALTVLKKYQIDNLLYYHNSVNIGSGYNWNRGVELARGEWVCLLHDDDVLCRDALVNIGRLIKHGKRSKKNLGYLNARRVEFTGKFADHVSGDFRKYPQERLTRFGMTVCGHTSAGAPTCGTAILKKAYVECGGINYDYGPSADAVLCYQIMKNYDVVNTDCILGGYRWDDNATLKKSTILNLITADDLIMKYVLSRSKPAVIWGKMFGAAISWRNVHRKKKNAECNAVAISAEEYRHASLYNEPCKIVKLIYLGIYAFYRALRLLLSL